MKYFSKLLSMFLVGAMLYSTGCTDYETDINNLKQDVDQIKQELNGQIDALKADLGADITALEGAIEAANNAIAANQTAIDGLKAADAAMDTRVKAAEEAIIKANADIAAANAAIAENADAIEENAKAIEAAKKSIADAVAAIEEANKAIDENADAIEDLKKVDEEFAKDITALEENLATLETELKAYADDLFDQSKKYTDAEIKKLNESLTNALNAHIDAFTAYQAKVEGIIAALEARVAANEEAIEGLQANVEELYELHDIQGQLIENLDGRFETFVEYTEQELQVLRDADANLAKLIAANTDYIKNVENSLIDYQKIANEQFTKAFGLIADNLSKINALEAALEAEKTERIAMGKAIHEHIDNVQAELKDMIAKLDAKYADEVKAIYAKYDAIVAELEAELENLEKALEAEKTERIAMGKALHEDINNVRDYLLDEVAKLEKQTEAEFKNLTDTMNKKFENVNTALGNMYVELQGKIKEVNDALEAYKAVVDGKLTEMSIQIDMLIKRVQSIVYVPTTADHKADVVSLFYIGERNKEFIVSEGYVEMTFRVTPAAAAQQLVAYYNAQSDKAMPIFTLEPEQVSTRGQVPSFTINSIELDEKGNGRFIVNATPSLLHAFYEGQISYSVALRLIKGYDDENPEYNADIVSDYVNLNPVRKYTDGLVLVDKRDTVVEADGTLNYEIAYADTEKEVVLLEGYEPRYEYNDEYLTAEELAKLGFNVAPITTACENTAFLANGTKAETLEKANFAFVAEKGECYETVKLASESGAIKETVGNHLDTKHVYTIADDVNFTFNTRVNIVRDHRDAKLASLWYKWRHVDYLVAMGLADANSWPWWPFYPGGGDNNPGGNQTPVLKYEGASRQFVLAVEKSEIPADILADGAKYVIENWAATEAAAKLIAKDGTSTEFKGMKVTPVAYDAEKDAWTVAVEGWKFHEPGAKYDIEASYVFDEIEIKFCFQAEFINLIPMEYDHEPSIDFAYSASQNEYVSATTDLFSVADALAAKYPELLTGGNDDEWGYFENNEDLYNALAAVNPQVNYLVTRDNVDYDGTAVNDKEVSKFVKEFNSYAINTNNPFFGEKKSYLQITREADLNGKVVIQKNHIVTDDDIFNFTTSMSPKFENNNQVMPITVKAHANVVVPEYFVIHVPYAVKTLTDDKYKYASDVVGLWDPNNLYESAVSKFSTKAVNLKDGFEVAVKDANSKDGYRVLVVNNEKNELNELGITLEFAIDGEYKGISIRNDKITLDYMGYAPSVGVNGTLKVGEIIKRTAFNEYNGNYKVNKYDPIGNFVVGKTDVIYTSLGQESYTVNALHYASLKDIRGRELINKASMDNNEPWVIGDGTNGFAQGVNAGSVFSLSAIEYSYAITDKAGNAVNYLDKNVKFDNGVLKFNNMNNLKLQEDIYVTVAVAVSYPWTEGKSEEITFRVTSETMPEVEE